MPRKRKNVTAAMKVKAPGAKKSIDRMKYEIANEFGVNLGASASSRENGMVGGEITKRLIQNSMKEKKTNTNSARSKKRTKRSKKNSN